MSVTPSTVTGARASAPPSNAPISPEGWGPRVADLVLGPAGRQRLSTKIALSSLITYLPCMLLVYLGGRTGLIHPPLVWPVIAGLVLTLVTIYAALRSGWSRRFKDPGLTVPQMLISVTWDAIGFAAMGAAHGGMLLMAALTVSYGIFALRGKAVFLVQGYTILVMGATMGTMAWLDPANFPPRVMGIVFPCLVLAVVMLSWSGHLIAQIRLRDTQTRKALEATLQQIQERATHDALTGLHNRRHMQATLEHHLARADREGFPLVIAMLDIDHFKRVNDEHGHAAGDMVLTEFARRASLALPPTAPIARWGGEEFLVLSTRPISAAEFSRQIDRLRDALHEVPVSLPDTQRCISFSAGVAEQSPGQSASELISAADAALYLAKERGRGRCEVAQPQTCPVDGGPLHAHA